MTSKPIGSDSRSTTFAPLVRADPPGRARSAATRRVSDLSSPRLPTVPTMRTPELTNRNSPNSDGVIIRARSALAPSNATPFAAFSIKTATLPLATRKASDELESRNRQLLRATPLSKRRPRRSPPIASTAHSVRDVTYPPRRSYHPNRAPARAPPASMRFCILGTPPRENAPVPVAENAAVPAPLPRPPTLPHPLASQAPRCGSAKRSYRRPLT